MIKIDEAKVKDLEDMLQEQWKITQMSVAGKADEAKYNGMMMAVLELGLMCVVDKNTGRHAVDML